MADQGTKKVTVLKNNLPPLNSEEERYIVRYRIISEDRNRISHWSPQFAISPVPIGVDETGSYNISLEAVGNSLSVKWNISAQAQEEFAKNPSLALSSYDIYVGWGSQTIGTELLQYFATVSGNYISIPIPQEPVPVNARVVVQNMTYPRQYLLKAAIADSKDFNL